MSKKSCPVRRTCEYLNLISELSVCTGALSTGMFGLTCNCAVNGPDAPPNKFVIATSL